LPDLGDVSDASVSEQQEKTIGRRIMQEIRADRSHVDDAELQDYIKALGGRLVAATPGTFNDNRRDFEFFLLLDDQINAFAFFGGVVGTNSSLILATQSEAELAGVMGHEIAHIVQRHLSRGVDSQRKAAPLQMLGLALAILAARSNSSSSGQATEAAVATTAALQMQNQLDFTREFEREADRMGIQILTRAGFEPQGMVSFFERLLRASRHADGKVPGYLRTHPLTTERIADMQNRVDQMKSEQRAAAADSIDYRFAQAKLRVLAMGAKDAAPWFRQEIAQRTVLRNRADHYGLALALARANDYREAERELAVVRPGAPNAWVETLAAELAAAQRKWDEALQIYRAGMQAFPQHRALVYGYLNTLFESGQIDAALAAVNDRLKSNKDDPRLYEMAARCHERKNQRLLKHRALAESYFRQGNLAGAIDQMELAVRAKDGDFYEVSGAEARLRELKLAFRNRPLLPGEKRDTPRDREEDEPAPRPGNRRG
ncbi:MAG TPA: M48 family metalloprotease, partial [Usitatibacteraceae bacterium]|nr:M48 family metalloprotease [Usitatibacteraceae bacterium]